MEQKSWGGEPRAGWAASVTEVLQPRTNGKVAPTKVYGSFLHAGLTGQSWGRGPTEALVGARLECHLGDLGCKLYHRLSSGRRLGDLLSKEGSVRTHTWRSAQKLRVPAWTSRVFQDWHIPKCRAASGPLELCF